MSEISFLVRNICQESLHSTHQTVISMYPNVTQYEPYIIVSQDLTLMGRESSPEKPKPCAQGTARSQIIEPCAMSLELPLLVRSGVFFVFFVEREGPEHLPFRSGFRPFAKVGNSQLHSTWFDYLKSCGIYSETSGSP